MIPIPNASEPAVESGGALGRRWYDFLARLSRSVNGPLPLASFSVVELPFDPADGCIAYAIDAGGGGVPVYSRNGVWLRFDDNTEVS